MQPFTAGCVLPLRQPAATVCARQGTTFYIARKARRFWFGRDILFSPHARRSVRLTPFTGIDEKSFGRRAENLARTAWSFVQYKRKQQESGQQQDRRSAEGRFP